MTDTDLIFIRGLELELKDLVGWIRSMKARQSGVCGGGGNQ